jgi:hypothetical protein
VSRFVRPETRTLTLENGDTLIVRARLTAGETRAQYARMYAHTPDGSLRRNPLLTGVGLIVAYLLDWNLQDDNGQVVQIRDLSPDDLTAVIDSLDMQSFEEIKTAIETHESAMLAEREAAKKNPVGAMAL